MYDIDSVEKYELNLRNGQKLRYFRLHNNIKAKNLAKTLDISISSLYYYERGERPIPDKIVSILNNLYMLDLELTGNKSGNSTFGNKFKQLRLKDDISQANFADILNVNIKYIQAIESGKKDITFSIDFLSRLYRCGYNLNWLFGDQV